MELGIAGHVALVTGAAHGLGAAIASALAKEGCRVGVWDRDGDGANRLVERIKAAGGDACALVGSVDNPDEVRELTQAAAARLGDIQILVNNAGYSADSPIEKMSDAAWHDIIGVCLTGAFYCTRAVVPAMIARKYGRIINISSRAHLGEFNKVNYCAAKAGLIGMTRALSLDLGPHGITVNAIAPGLVRTERVQNLPHYAEINTRSQARQPIKREGLPTDVADGVLYLASAGAGFVTGEVLHITGGRYSSS